MQSFSLVPSYLPGWKSHCHPLLSPVSPPDNLTPTALILMKCKSSTKSFNPRAKSHHQKAPGHFRAPGWMQKRLFLFSNIHFCCCKAELACKALPEAAIPALLTATRLSLCCCLLILIGPIYGTADCLQSIQAGKSWLFFFFFSKQLVGFWYLLHQGF